MKLNLGILRGIVDLASRNLTRQRRRSLLALGTVCGGVVAFLLAGGFIHWIFLQMREATIHAQLGHIQITRPGYFKEGISDPYRYLLPDDTSAVSAIAPDQISAVSPRLAFSGLVSKEDSTVSFIGEGIDPVREAPITSAISIVSGKDLTASPPDSAIVGEGLAANLGVAAGDRIVLLVTTSNGSINAVELTVAGLFATSTKAYDDTALRVPIPVARKLMRVQGATSWVVLLHETSQTQPTAELFRSKLPPKEFEVVPWEQLADFYTKTVTLFSKQVGVVRLLIAIIVILTISNTLSMAVAERTGEIGTSMALGVRRSGIMALFICEGLLLGTIGGLLGIGLGYLVAAAISAVGIPMPPPPGMARGYIGAILVSPGLALDAFLLAFVTTLLASILPAWKASRMNIVDALRHQR
ncbi:ABC transporter permease [Zoogloea dura]|jgi:putative ABC transport system permease protein|uniref:ABC transporter permease n=1 Tax=Zoogloea dura TaxID=2728840 RepID=A0A848G3P9_9RHOO|nr:FtsX-like permease family protein [Zoogloea dura]NML26847.1 ABC transporter permease [Zoogloea dura]